MPNAIEASSTFAIIVSRALSISPTMTTNINRRCLTSSDGSTSGNFAGRLLGPIWYRTSGRARQPHCRMERRLEGRSICGYGGLWVQRALLSEMTGDLWAYRGRGGETEFIERLIGSADQLELLCNNCRDCYVWHDLPIGWSTRLGLIAYLVRRRAPAFMRRKLNRAFRKIWLTEGKLWL